MTRDLEKENRTLRDRVDYLEEELRQEKAAKRALEAHDDTPLVIEIRSTWKFRNAQAKMLAALMMSPDGFCTYEVIFNAITTSQFVSDKIIQVQLVELRKRLREIEPEIAVETVFGSGLRISAEHRETLRARLARDMAAS